MKRLRTFIRLSPGERLLLLRAAIFLSIYRIGLWLLPFRVVQRVHNFFSRPKAMDVVPVPRRAAPAREEAAPGFRPARAPTSRGATPREPGGLEFPLSRLRWAVMAASRYVPQPVCLVRAMTAQLLLGRAGIPSSLHIGVNKGERGDFGAHAWLECQGEVVAGEEEMQHYTPLVAWQDGKRLEGDAAPVNSARSASNKMRGC